MLHSKKYVLKTKRLMSFERATKGQTTIGRWRTGLGSKVGLHALSDILESSHHHCIRRRHEHHSVTSIRGGCSACHLHIVSLAQKVNARIGRVDSIHSRYETGAGAEKKEL
jgi:hypothetical protein